MIAIETPTATSGCRHVGGPQRILLVVHGYPPHQTMGAELQAQRKAHWWQAQGRQVDVLAADPQPAATWGFDRVEEACEEIEGIAVTRVRFAVPDATRSLRDTYAHPLLGEAIERALARVRYDLLYHVSGYLFGTLPLQIAARHGIPSVLFAMDYWQICQRVTLLRPDGECCLGPKDPADCAACRIADRAFARRLGPAGNRLVRAALVHIGRHLPVARGKQLLGVGDFADREASISAALSGVALTVVNSRFLADQLLARGVPPDRLLVVRQGIDAREFATHTPAPIGDQRALRVLYLGQINWHKGADLAIDAVARLHAAGRAIQLHLHGPVTATAPYMQNLRERIARLGDNAVIQLGTSLDRRDLVAALREADVLVVPSRWYENSPNVILEAFAAGTPVIAANHGGMAEMVRDGVDGLLVAPGDPAALGAALERLLIDPALLTQLRAGVRPPHGLAEEMAQEDAALAHVR